MAESTSGWISPDILPIDPRRSCITHDCGVLGVEWTKTETIRFVRNATGKPIHPPLRFLLDESGQNVVSVITEPVPLEVLKGSWGFLDWYEGGAVPDDWCFFATTWDRCTIRRVQ